MIDRRFPCVVTITLILLATALTVDAQQSKKAATIGILTLTAPESSADSAARVEAFRQGLRAFGWIEGQNLTIEYRWAAGRPDRLPALAEELVRLHVDLIVVGGGGNPVVQAVKNATTTIPIVMPLAADVVETGLVASLARPGGNITGRSDSAIELDGKLFELLKETLPQVTRALGRVRALLRAPLQSGPGRGPGVGVDDSISRNAGH
jgi:putative ABC transport system substrate-binding protein